MESGNIPNDAIKASTELDVQHNASRSRLNTKPEGEQAGAWVPLESDENQWLQVDLGKVVEITKVCTQGGGESVEYRVNSYVLSFSEDQENFQEYQENGETKVNIHAVLFFINLGSLPPPNPPTQHGNKSIWGLVSKETVLFPRWGEETNVSYNQQSA